VTLITEIPAGNFRDDALPFQIIRQPSSTQLWKHIRQTHVLHIAGPALLPLFFAHLAGTPTDPFAQAYVHSILQMLGVHSILDVGSATGRGLKDFQKALPGAFVCGLEPVAALVQQARLSGDSASLAMVQASGEALPFSDASFDAVCEFAILHHVPDPAKVLREMMRVSRRVLVVVDCNGFGQGPWPLRILKLLLCKLGLWEIFDYIRTRGKR
jgi:SAM-dependent methyltransferase